MQGLEIPVFFVGAFLGLVLGMALAAKYKRSKSGQIVSNGSGGVETWAGIWLFIVGGSMAVMMVPTMLAVSYVGVSREIKEGKVYIGDKRVTEPWEVYKYALDGFFLSSTDREIRDYEEEIREADRKVSAFSGKAEKSFRRQHIEAELKKLKAERAAKQNQDAKQ